jgi:pyruvate-ferredoxin/flavodoxin oxidoreductase
MTDKTKQFKYPGVREALDGGTAAIMCERESTDAAGAYPITPSTQMGEYWAEAAADGHINISGRPLIFIEPEGEHAAAAVTAGLSMTGLRATNFSSGQGIAYMHESLYAAVGKRLTYVLNIGCRAMTKATLNVHAGHDDYHAVDDTGFFQLFAKSAQEVADLNIIAHRTAELALTPGIIAQDGFLTTHLIESLLLPERDLIAEYLGKPEDIIDTPTAAQRIMFGEKRRRIPELWDVDNPVMFGTVQNQDSYMQGVAAQRPFFFDHVAGLADQAMNEFHALTGRRYNRVATYRAEDADYLIVCQGSAAPSSEAVADYLREKRGIKLGVVNMTMFRPFPSDLLGPILKGRKGVAVLERTDQPLAVDLPLMREIRATVSKCIENGRAAGDGESLPYAHLAAYKEFKDAPPLYSGSFGLGSRDLQAEGIIGAVENMLPGGPKKKFYYLSVDFIRDTPFTPKQEVYQEQILEAYPKIKDLAVHGSENPNLMPDKSVTVRFHSVGGWGAITTGKNLAMTLFDLLGYHIKANPKYGSEKKGQPTTYYLSAAPEPIRMNCEYYYVDVALSPDPNVFNHSNPLAGLKKGGVFIIQSSTDSPEAMWRTIPSQYQKQIVENDIRVFYLDGFKIAREEANNPELQLRMQGIAFQGAFFAASPVMQNADLTEEQLFKAIQEQLQHKFGSKGARVVEDNMRVVRRGFDEVREVKNRLIGSESDLPVKQEADVPIMLKRWPASDAPITDIHRFWEQTGNFYLTGKGSDNLVDPFIGMSCIPAATGVFRDMTQIRFEHPKWNPEKCIGCGACWTICPDTALPGLVSKPGAVLGTAVKRIKQSGRAPKHLGKALVPIEKKWRELMLAGTEKDSARNHLFTAIEAYLVSAKGSETEQAELAQELQWLREVVGDFQLSITKPYFTLKEKDKPGRGGLLSINVNPYTCKGCMECVRVCPEYALVPMEQTSETVARLRKSWEFWLELPNTPQDYILIDDIEEGIGTLETMLLNKECYQSMVGGDGACLGCGEKTAIHLFTSTVTALMQSRVVPHVKHIEELITGLEKHIRAKLAASVDVADTDLMKEALDSLADKELTLSNLAAALDQKKLGAPLDAEWMKRVTNLLAKLHHLRWLYKEGVTKQGRSKMGMLNATGCTSVWGSTYPYNPYPFPWSNHLFQDPTSVAMGVFEGHMAKMADGFKAVRMAELELEDKYDPAKHDEFFTRFTWKQFTDDEFELCPPVVAVGGDGAMYDIGFQNLSRLMMSGKPVKVLIVDTQVYSNTGGQACTSGFIGQISDMAQFGKVQRGKEEIRKEMGLIAMAHRTTFMLQASISNPAHLIAGVIRGIKARRPAVFVFYTPCMPEHGIGDDVAKQQARLAVESRAFPLYIYDPGNGPTAAECFELDGNPDVDAPWPTYALDYFDEKGQPAKLELPMTFADFAVTEGRFRKHFKKAPADTWDDKVMVSVAEFLKLSPDDREGKYPFVWVVDRKRRLGRMIVSQTIVKSCEEREQFWTMLRALAGSGGATRIGKEARAEIAGAAAALPADFEPATVSSDECISCGACIGINNKIFGYDENDKAMVLDPKAGPYKDIVQAAEKCPSRCIHPGTPANPSEKGLDKLMKRAAKFK